VALAFVLILLPSLVKAATIIDVQFAQTNSNISDLNPTAAAFDVVYSAGSIKSGDGLTTFGSYMEITPRYAGTASPLGFNYIDGVAVLPGGNVYYKRVRNFADPPNTARGIILGGDGAFFDVFGSIAQISSTVYRITLQ
jgi:hypothetical protein